ncbi:MAG: hypothetical protein ACLR0U_16615 [Enterocloster clostridioformis]
MIVVNEAGENDKISGEILNQLTSYVEEEERARRKSCHMVNVMEEILNHVDLETHMRAYDVCHVQRVPCGCQGIDINQPAGKVRGSG